MAENINVVMLTGNLTRDSELRTTQGGTQVLRFSVAVNERRKNGQTGEWEDVPNYIDCTTFGNRAGALAQHLRKGTKVAVRGRLHWHQWQTDDGSKRSKVDVTVDALEFMSRNQQQPYAPTQAPQAAPRQGYQQPVYAAPQGVPRGPQPQAQPVQGQLPDVYDEDIPF